VIVIVRNEPGALARRTEIVFEATSETCLTNVAVLWLKSRWVNMSVPFKVMVALLTRLEPSLLPF
jgi:hypothetical protein